jgi:hypothetical protein
MQQEAVPHRWKSLLVLKRKVFAKVKKGESGMLAHLTFADDPDYIADEL